jgi:hypothetical protein
MGGTLIQTYLTLHQKAWGSLGQNISQNRNLYRAQGKSYLRVVHRDGSYNTIDLLRQCFQSVELEAAGLSTGNLQVNRSRWGNP